MAKCVLTRTPTPQRFCYLCSKEQVSGLVDSMQHATPSRLGQFDDVVLDLFGLHRQIFDMSFDASVCALKVQIVILVPLRFGSLFLP